MKLATAHYTLLAFFILNSCGYVNTTNKTIKISSIRLVYHLQLPKIDGTIADILDSLDVFQYGDLMIYKDEAPHIYTQVKVDKNMNEISEKVVLDTIKHNYVIFRKNHRYGLFFDSIDVKTPKRISVDSFKHSRTLDHMPFFTSNDSLSTSVKADKSPYLIEVRVPKIIKDGSYANSKTYYYNKEYKNAPITFSKKLDSASHMKLFKMRFSYDKVLNGNLSIPAREFTFELKNAKKDTDVLKLVSRYSKLENSFKL